jgi:hypothetical protein
LKLSEAAWLGVAAATADRVMRPCTVR